MAAKIEAESKKLYAHKRETVMSASGCVTANKNTIVISPVRRLYGSLRLPGDKAISHRAALLSAIAEGVSRIENFSTSEDCAATLRCLEQLGVRVEREDQRVRIEGLGMRGLRCGQAPLDCGNSGSTMRMLSGILAGQDFVSFMTGDASLRSRPMCRIIEPLERIGARIESEGGRAPLSITGSPTLLPISYEMPLPSAQVKSCILLAGLSARGRTSVIERHASTRDHTERLLLWLGVPVETSEIKRRDGGSTHAISVQGPTQILAHDISIPGDISSAAFFIAAAALLPGSHLEVNGIGLNDTRTQFLTVLHSLGADVSVRNVREVCNEPVGDVRVRGSNSNQISLVTTEPGSSNVLNGAAIPKLIDELPLLAVVGTQVEGGITIRDAAELRVKESDRIAATVANLRTMGAEVEEYEDGLAIKGRTRLRGATLDAHGDHRIAMSFTVAALIAEGVSEVQGADSVRVSFPEFFHLLESLVEK